MTPRPRLKIICEYAKWTTRAAGNGSPLKAGDVMYPLLADVTFSESPQTRVGGNGRRSTAREPQEPPCSRPLLRPRDYAYQAHAPVCSSRVRREDVDGLDAAVQAGSQGP